MGRRRLPAYGVLVVALLALSTVPGMRAAGAATPPGYLAGTGQLQGTELVQDEQFTGALCIQATKTVFGLRGAGTYHGQTAGGQEVVYKAEIGSNQTLYGDGPVQLEVENTQTYYHGPQGTHGTSDASCSPATAGSPVPAAFRIFAADHIYKLSGSTQGPCHGTGTFARGGDPNNPSKWHAEWTLSEDCTVIGNAAGTPGTGVAPSGTAHTHDGTHSPCFNPPCQDNVKVDYAQYLPLKGFHVTLGGPTSAQIGAPVTLTAAVTNDGQPVPNAAVTFSVSGPAASAPPGGAATTGADGRATFTFTAASAGDYSVSASATNVTQNATGSYVVTFTPTAPPSLTLAGPGQWQTEENLTVVATLTNAGNPVPATSVSFSVTGAGQANPASGSALTDQNGKASFTFTGNRAGDYTVTASGSVAGQPASATLGVHFEINTFNLVGSVPLASGAGDPYAALVDPAGRYAYFGQANGQVTKLDLTTFQNVGSVAVGYVTSGVIDPAGHAAYFAINGALHPTVAKVNLDTFQAAGVVTLDSVKGPLASAVIDTAGQYAYFGTAETPLTSTVGKIVKVDLTTFQPVATLTLPAGENALESAVREPSGRYAYFGAAGDGSAPGHVVKIDLETFQRVSALTLSGSAENRLRSAVIDPTGTLAYFGTVSSPGRVVKVDLTTLTRVGSVTMASTENALDAGVIDPQGRFAYFAAENAGGTTVPGIVVKIDLATLARTHAISLPSDELGGVSSAVMDPAGNFAYFGKGQGGGVQPNPGQAVKFAVSRPPVAWLTAGNDSYTTPYAAALSVPAPGVLANDADTQDPDALGANLSANPAHGTVTLNRNGSFSYTPADGFSGADTFTYQVDDGMDYSAPATVTVTVGAAPQGVQAVSGSALGFETNVSLFGGPATVKGGPGSTCGQAGQPACADGESPAVALPAGGGNLTATDPDGNAGVYGPAYIFENHGPLTVSASGATGPTGSVTASAAVDKVEDNDPFHAGSPDGQVSSTCSAGLSGFAGSARIVNGYLVTSTDPTTGDPKTTVTFDHTWDPAPNTTYEGTLNHVGDSWRIVFNEQVVGPDAITVNAVHMYLLGPTAVGDMIIGASHCGITQAAPDTAPVANADAYTATSGRALSVAGPGVLANDTDADSQALRSSTLAPVPPPASGGGAWTFPSDPAHGTLRLGVDGAFTYTSTAGFSGTDTFTYLAQDSRGRSSAPATVTVTVNPAPPRSVADFDGDGRTDRSVFRSGAWYADSQPPAYFGLSGDVAVPGDYDGDGKADHAVYRGGAWLVEGQPTVWLGTADDIPVPGDYDGDGRTDRAVFRPSSGAWFIDGQPTVYLGVPGDVAVPGDYNGDGRTDVAVWRPGSGAWFVNGQATSYLGLSGDVPVPGDYDANGTTDRAVWRPGSGGWFVDGQPTAYLGLSGDVPVPGDYDANRSTDRAVWRPASGGWYVDGQPTTYLGAAGDQPLPLPAAAQRALA